MTPAARLLTWFDANGRDLPWRKTRDPYRILVSEIMLQQTQVPRVVLFYAKWLKRFPTWTSLAKASNGTVIRAWAGLGYNRRALMLRDIACEVVKNGVPKTEDEWRVLKGIGPYTAAALAAFSDKQRTFPIDTTIRRVADRLLLGIPFPDPKADDRLREASDEFLPRRGRFYDVPQALFDLATAICTKSPACRVCPMNRVCKAAPKFLAGNVTVPKAMIFKAHESRHRNKPHPDRIYRGRILQLVRDASRGVSVRSIGSRVDATFDPASDAAWLQDMLRRLERDHLIRRRGGSVFLA